MSKTIDNYELGGVLGKGSFARVYQCTNKLDGKRYAMKVIKKQALSESQIARLRIEIAIMQAVNHPHIVHMYDLLESDLRYMLVMDLVDGGELMGKMNDVLPEEQAADYLIQIAATVRFCHGLGIVHRDLKFENVLVKDGDFLVLSDFGLGNISSSPNKTFFTSKTLCGSPHYIAPEITDGKYDGRTADIWSLGILFYAMLALEFPFQSSDYQQIFQMAHECKYTMPAGASPEAQDLIRRILVPDPTKRATWDEIFASRFFQKYATILNENEVQVKSTKMVIKYWPTSQDQALQKSLHEKSGIPLMLKPKH